MKTVRLTIWFFALMNFRPAWSLQIPSVYKSGVEICREQHNGSKDFEKWVKVPVAYNKSRSGETPLYTWTQKKYDPSKKTVVFVSGGPGDTAHHSFFDLKDWNVIFFDQRGNSCSRPADKGSYLDRSFYSSENTARDIEEIRKAYEINQISVYGVSYGTVPAHLYGHFFPLSTRAIVLEGVIFQGGKHLMSPARRIKLLQNFFDSLPAATQDQILALSNHPKIAKNWFSNVGMMMLYMDRPFESFQQFLENVIWNETTAVEILKSFEKNEPEDTEYGFGHVLMGMIGCQEMGMNLSDASFYSVFSGRVLVSDQFNLLQKHYCETLGFQETEKLRPYRADHYPTVAQTTYFQGVLDGATVASAAISHYKSSALSKAQLILIRQGGHLPVYGALSSGYEKGPSLTQRQKILEKALSGQMISSRDLKRLKEATSMDWVGTQKK